MKRVGVAKNLRVKREGRGAKGDRRERILVWLTHDTISKFLYLMVSNNGPPIF